MGCKAVSTLNRGCLGRLTVVIRPAGGLHFSVAAEIGSTDTGLPEPWPSGAEEQRPDPCSCQAQFADGGRVSLYRVRYYLPDMTDTRSFVVAGETSRSNHPRSPGQHQYLELYVGSRHQDPYLYVYDKIPVRAQMHHNFGSEIQRSTVVAPAWLKPRLASAAGDLVRGRR